MDNFCRVGRGDTKILLKPLVELPLALTVEFHLLLELLELLEVFLTYHLFEICNLINVGTAECVVV